MKKIMKRSLILALVVMTMITMAFCVSAANYRCDKCNAFVPLVEGDTILATCETPGYTELVCKPCKEKGITTVITTTDDKAPLGHLYTELHELVGEADNGYYKHITACTRIPANTERLKNTKIILLLSTSRLHMSTHLLLQQLIPMSSTQLLLQHTKKKSFTQSM